MANRDSLILDACVLLNLLATDVTKEILSLAAKNVFISDLVRDESLYLQSDDGSGEAIPIDLRPYIEQNVIQTCSLESSSENMIFVDLAAQLDDGEAESLAIGLSRNWFLATDDKKARRIFVENTTDDNMLLSTSDLICEWAEANRLSSNEMKTILSRIEEIARYIPPKADRNYVWWNNIMTR